MGVRVFDRNTPTDATRGRAERNATMTGQQRADDPEETAIDNPEGADEQDSSVDRGHLDDVEDGCGCTEIWEHLSENREEAADD
ncbi:hypothetical protein SAMN05216559_4123 [Halomicrobium zhouii]|uniref:Uncharacterized protein n=2 Tax=Halomicrobium zhouii TaxID=767519 RepID=A0A1I6MAY0_9EURY|nr:hypothetical protein SAMN05216559_4123 [Halomicrobium zhouii]